ncbi:hypothetical protein pb186bvf_013125 [Paramecium bursaria]
MKFIIAALASVLSFVVNLHDHKFSMTMVGLFQTYLNIHGMNEFDFKETFILGYLIIFSKGLVIELYLYNTNIFSNPKTLLLLAIVTVSSLLIGKKFVIGRLYSLVNKSEKVKFLIGLIDKINQSLYLSVCLQHLLSKSTINYPEFIIITFLLALTPNIFVSFLLLEKHSLSETFQIMKVANFDNIVSYFTISFLTLAAHFGYPHLHQTGISKDNFLNGVVVNLFIFIYFIQSSLKSKKLNKSKIQQGEKQKQDQKEESKQEPQKQQNQKQKQKKN